MHDDVVATLRLLQYHTKIFVSQNDLAHARVDCHELWVPLCGVVEDRVYRIDRVEQIDALIFHNGTTSA